MIAIDVKDLKSQTARATEEISKKICEMYGVVGQSSVVIGSINARIRKVNTVSNSIAASVAQRGTAPPKIVHNLVRASIRTSGVIQIIAGVAQASKENGVATQVLTVFFTLSQKSKY